MSNKKPKPSKERLPDQRAAGAAWRLFIAIPMPEPVQELVARIVESLSDRAWPVRWIGANSAHLTLHFLGDTAPERAELLRMSLGATITRHAPFTLSTGGLGVFPDLHRPRVLWLGLDGDADRLIALQSDIGKQLAKLGFAVDSQRFHPHITLGRVRDDPPASLGADVRRAFTDPGIQRVAAGIDQQVDIREVLLVRSVLDRDGARHTPIAHFPLGGSPH